MKIHHKAAHDKSIAERDRQTTVVDCDECGEETEVLKYVDADHRFCGEECRMDWLSRSRSGDSNPAKDPKVRQQISDTLSGRSLSSEHRRNISQAQSGRQVTWSDKLKGRQPADPFPEGDENPSWSGGEPYDPGPLTQKQKELIRESRGRMCEECGKLSEEQPKKMSVHHIDNDVTNNDAENLKRLCNSCHAKEHN